MGAETFLINSQLKRILFISSDKKKWNKSERDRKNMEKENNSDESDFSENEIPDLNSLKPFKGAAKLYFMYYSRVAIILFSTG